MCNETDTCGFCLEENCNTLWKCSQCSWTGHPACWLELRQEECWNKKRFIRHSHVIGKENIWKNPTGQCPQCRIKFSWLYFLNHQRMIGNMPDRNICWVCQQSAEPGKDSWTCCKNHQPRCVHWNCLWKISGWGFVKPECIECGSVPMVWGIKLRKLLNWQSEIPLLKSQNIATTGDWYRVFFQTTEYGECTKDGIVQCWKHYLHFVQRSILVDPNEWWKSFMWSTYFIYEQFRKMMIYEGKVMDEFSLKVLNPELYQQGVCYMNILYKSKLHLEGNNPLMTATRKYYVPVNNRVSAPIPEEFFPETWFQLCDRTDLTQSS